jgi:hypothetical protein
MAKPGSVRKETAGHMFESLRIQESTQATGNHKMQQLRSWLPFRLWDVLDWMDALDSLWMGALDSLLMSLQEEELSFLKHMTSQ